MLLFDDEEDQIHLKGLCQKCIVESIYPYNAQKAKHFWEK